METSLLFSIYAYSQGDLIHFHRFKYISPDFYKLPTGVASSQFNIFT